MTDNANQMFYAPPCPKCGDDTASRAVRWGWFMVGRGREVEAIQVRCLACGFEIGLRHPLDHERAGQPVEA